MGTVFEVQSRAMTRVAGVLSVVAAVIACEPRLLDVSGLTGDACGDQACAAGQVCVAEVCVAPVEVHGRVIDAITKAAIAGARVHGQDSGGTTPGPVAISDEEGRYVLAIGVPRTDAGAPAAGAMVTLSAFAAGHRPFPDGLRVALPIALADAAFDEQRGAYVVGDEANTTIGLIAASGAGVKISGHVGGDDPAGTLVVAEGPTPVYGLADVDGTYTLFDVGPGRSTVRGYRRGVSLVARAVEVAGEDLVDVDLAVDEKGAAGVGRGFGDARRRGRGRGDQRGARAGERVRRGARARAGAARAARAGPGAGAGRDRGVHPHGGAGGHVPGAGGLRERRAGPRPGRGDRRDDGPGGRGRRPGPRRTRGRSR
jgi:hypothetical protein